MEYHGKLYGKIGNKYFDTAKTSNDYDDLEKENERLKDKLESCSMWISTKERLPKPNNRVLIIRDHRKWDKKIKPYISIADVGFFEKETLIGGPRALTGYSKIEGIYFSVPAILHPESVTYWQPLPEIDED